jgi:integrase/recombinase XerC
MQYSYITDFLQYLERERRASIETLRGYRDDLTYFMAYISEQPYDDTWEQISTEMIRNWVVHLAGEGKKATVIRRRMAGLRAFYRFLQRKGLIKTNPVQSIPLPKIPKRLPRFISMEGMKKLEQENIYTTDFKGIRDKLIIELLYGTGMRRAEVAQMKDKDIHWERREISVLGKGGKSRILPIHPGLLSIMEVYLKERSAIKDEVPETFLITNKGKRVYTRFIYEVSTRYLHLITSIDNKGPHLLRHTFATHLMDNGADIQSVKALLGHSSLAATQVYMHNSAERLKKIYEQAHPKAHRK